MKLGDNTGTSLWTMSEQSLGALFTKIFKKLYYSLLCLTESNLPSVQISSTVLNIVFQRQEYIFNIYQEKGVFYFHDLAGAS